MKKRRRLRSVAHGDWEQNHHVYRLHERKERHKSLRVLEKYMTELNSIQWEIETERNLKPWWMLW